MFLYAGATAALALLASSAAAQVPADTAQREAIVREQFLPAFAAAMRPPMEASWQHFPAEAVYPDELDAARDAHTREVDDAVERMGTAVMSIIVSKVPMEELVASTIENSPGWRAAMAEIDRRVIQQADVEGRAMAMRVIETGCGVRAEPSPACAQLLAFVAEVREGRATTENAVPD